MLAGHPQVVLQVREDFGLEVELGNMIKEEGTKSPVPLPWLLGRLNQGATGFPAPLGRGFSPTKLPAGSFLE